MKPLHVKVRCVILKYEWLQPLHIVRSAVLLIQHPPPQTGASVLWLGPEFQGVSSKSCTQLLRIRPGDRTGNQVVKE